MLSENALSILTGEAPNTVNRSLDIADASMPANVSAGLPAALVSRRPDVRQQELALLESNALVGIAQANMYPALKITAGGGINSFKFDNWFQIPASLFGSALEGLPSPYFKKTIENRSEVAKFNVKNVLMFRQSVLNAMGEVSDAMASNEQLKTQELTAVDRYLP